MHLLMTIVGFGKLVNGVPHRTHDVVTGNVRGNRRLRVREASVCRHTLSALSAELAWNHLP